MTTHIEFRIFPSPTLICLPRKLESPVCRTQKQPPPFWGVIIVTPHASPSGELCKMYMNFKGSFDKANMHQTGKYILNKP